MGALLKSRWIWIAGIIAVLVAVYAIVGFKVAPGIVRKQATQFVRETYARELKLGAIRINPFLLTFEARDIALPDSDGQPMLALQRFFIDFELSSLWRRAYVFRDVDIDVPYIRSVLRADGSMNLADLAVPSGPEEPDSEIPALWIKALAVSQGKIDYVDQLNRREAFQTEFAPVQFTLQDFRTTPEGGDFSLAATGAGGATIEWRGQFSLAPAVSSDGEFSIRNLSVSRVADLLGDVLPFAVSKGSMELGGNYHVTLADILDLRLNLPAITFADLALRARGVDADWIQVPELKVEGVELVMPVQNVSIASISATGLTATGWLNPDGTVSLQQLFAPAAAEEPAAVPGVAAAEPTVTPPVAEDDWNVRVAAIGLDSATVEIEDRMIAPGTQWKISPLNVQVKDATLDFTRPMQVSMDATINEQAPLKVSGTLALDPMVAELDVVLDKARMSVIQPYVLPYADLTITSGTLGAIGKLSMAPPGREGPELRFAGDITIDDFASEDNTLHEGFINFRRLQLQKLRYDMAPDAVGIDRVLVREPFARVVISREQILNISAVLDPEAAAAEAEQKRSADAVLAKETRTQKRQREKREAAAKKAAAAARKKAGPVALTQAPTAPEAMPIRIREVSIERGRMNFSDFNVQPNFAANIQNLSGKVTGLSSAFTSRAKVDLKGNIGEFEPVTIAGEIQPFAFDRFTDIGLKFENISLPVFNPYSGRFAGYNISKGKLTTDLHYLIQDRKLDAKHHILIDQLEWGDATPALGEASLPVRFATSLLKDRNGLIDLNIPVTGSLDDPKLRIGPIVWQIFKNLIVKAVTAPFALFGAMFKGAEDAQFVDFAPGSAAVEPGSVERLTALGKALVERPSVSLDVPIGAGNELDRPVLAQQRYELLLAAAAPAFATMNPKQQIDVLTAVLRKQSGAAPQLPAPQAAPEGTSRADARAMQEAATLDFLQKSLRSSVTVTDAELAALGEARAVSIQRVLLTDTGLEPNRVFLTREGKTGIQDDKVRFELGLK